MAPCKDSPRGCRVTARLAMLALTLFVVTGCGGSGGNDCYPLAEECPPLVRIDSFTVYGNDSPVNGREQIVAGINNGMFRLGLNVAPTDSGGAKIWVSDREDLGATTLEQEIVSLTCGYQPFCSFDLTMNCSFTVANKVSCSLGGGGSGPIQFGFPTADITPLLSGGNQTALFMVIEVTANGQVPAQLSVPVTFRYI